MLDAIVGLATSSGVGAVVGVVGNWLGKIEERKQAIVDNEHERAMRVHDLQELKLSQTHSLDLAERQLAQTETEGEIAADVKDADAFIESIKADQATGVGWVDAVRAMMRPLLSVYLVGLTTYVAVVVFIRLGGVESLPEDQLLELAEQIIQQVLFLTTAAVMWHFGSRRQGPIGATNK